MFLLYEYTPYMLTFVKHQGFIPLFQVDAHIKNMSQEKHMLGKLEHSKKIALGNMKEMSFEWLSMLLDFLFFYQSLFHEQSRHGFQNNTLDEHKNKQSL